MRTNTRVANREREKCACLVDSVPPAGDRDAGSQRAEAPLANAATSAKFVSYRGRGADGARGDCPAEARRAAGAQQDGGRKEFCKVQADLGRPVVLRIPEERKDIRVHR